MVNNCSLITIFLLISTCFSSCFLIDTREDFYKDELAEYDLCRMPIVEPYEIVSSDCFNGWTLSCINKDSCLSNASSFLSSVDSINYYPHYILFSTKGSSYQWGFVDVKRNLVYDLNNYDNFIQFTDSLQIGHNLYFTDSVTLKWKRTKELPWIDRL